MSQVNVSKIQHPKDVTRRPVQVASSGANIYINATGADLTPTVSARIKTASSNIRSGEVMLGEPTAESVLNTHNASFKTVGTGFRIGRGVRESMDIRGTTLNSDSNVYVSSGTVKLYNAPSGNYNINITNSAANSIGVTQTLNDKMGIGDHMRVCVMFPVTSSSGTLNNNGFTIDGTTRTVYWADEDDPTPSGGGTPGPGGSSGYDSYNFTITKTANNTYAVQCTFSHFE